LWAAIIAPNGISGITALEDFALNQVFKLFCSMVNACKKYD
jgi:hypothetical protein